MKIRTLRRITTSVTAAPGTELDLPEFHAKRLVACGACEAVKEDKPKKRSAKKDAAGAEALEKVNQD